MPIRESPDVADDRYQTETDGDGYRWPDGQYAQFYSGPTRLEQQRVMARDLERDRWLCIEPGWMAEVLRRLLRS